VVGDPDQANPPRPKFDEEQDVESVVRRTVSTVKKSAATMPVACARRNARHVTDACRGAGPSPLPRSTVQMVVATPTPQLLELALDAPVAPARVLPGQPQDHGYQVLGQRRPLE
jgi:hypothetical protein